MRLTVLGSGSAFSGAGGNAGYCLDGRLLIDCGTPAHLSLPRAGLGVSGIETVILTHFHADHTFQLPMLLGALALDAADPQPLRIAGPVGTREYVLRMLSTGYGAFLRDHIVAGIGLEGTVLVDGCDQVIGGYRVRAHSVVHSTGPSLAYAITGPDGATVGFSGDSTNCPGLHRAAAQSDLFVCECTGWDGPVPSHMWAEEVQALIAASPSTTVLITHLSERRGLPGALVAHDGLSLDVAPAGAPLPAPPETLGAVVSP